MRLPLRIVCGVVRGGRSYRDAVLADEDGRYQDLITVVAAEAANPDVLVFPAGYFQARSDRARTDLARRLRRGLRSAVPPFAVVVGIDQPRGSVRGHPYFAVHRTSSGKIVSMQKVSVRSPGRSRPRRRTVGRAEPSFCPRARSPS